jgi:hypothetical protein
MDQQKKESKYVETHRLDKDDAFLGKEREFEHAAI